MEPAGRRLARWALVAIVAAVYVSGAAAEEEGYKKAKKERILGVGLGVFLLSFFFFSMCGLCWIGTLLPEERNEQWIFNLTGTVVFVVVALILFLADERPQYVSREKTVRGYDDNFIGLVIVSLFMLAVTGFALAAVLCYHVCAPIEAPVIKKGLMGNRQGLFDTHGRCIQAQPTFAP